MLHCKGAPARTVCKEKHSFQCDPADHSRSRSPLLSYKAMLWLSLSQSPPKKNLTGLWRFRYCPADPQVACATPANLRICGDAGFTDRSKLLYQQPIISEFAPPLEVVMSRIRGAFLAA